MTIAQPRAINYAGVLASPDGQAIPRMFIEICIMVGCGLLVALQSPSALILRHLYAKRSNIKVDSFQFDLCDFVQFISAVIATAIVVITAIRPVDIARTDI